MRKLAISTQLKNALAQIESMKVSHADAITKLEKEKKQELDHKELHYKNSTTLQEQIDQMHLLLDGMAGALPKQAEGENSWETKKYDIMTRLASWIASKIGRV